MANTRSSMGWSDRGPLRGTYFSNRASSTFMTMVAQPVVMANFLPRKIQPKTSRMKFAQDEKADAERGVSFATSAATPVTPPKTKLLGNLKKYTPMVVMLMLRVMRVYWLMKSRIFSRVLCSIPILPFSFPRPFAGACPPVVPQTRPAHAPGSTAHSTRRSFPLWCAAPLPPWLF